jgi:hypothetical protein
MSWHVNATRLYTHALHFKQSQAPKFLPRSVCSHKSQHVTENPYMNQNVGLRKTWKVFTTAQHARNACGAVAMLYSSPGQHLELRQRRCSVCGRIINQFWRQNKLFTRVYVDLTEHKPMRALPFKGNVLMRATVFDAKLFLTRNENTMKNTALTMETTNTSETSVNLYQTTRPSTPQDIFRRQQFGWWHTVSYSRESTFQCTVRMFWKAVTVKIEQTEIKLWQLWRK